MDNLELKHLEFIAVGRIPVSQAMIWAKQDALFERMGLIEIRENRLNITDKGVRFLSMSDLERAVFEARHGKR